MGSRQSKVSEPDRKTAPKKNESSEASLIITPELLQQLKGKKEVPNAQGPRTLQEAYDKGVHDAVAHMKKEEASRQSEKAAAWSAVLEKDEEGTRQRVMTMVQDLNARVYRPPARSIKCFQAQEALLTCYTKELKDGDVLKCSELVSALEDCAKNTLTELVKRQQP